MILEKFDEYWGTPANIDTVKLQVIAHADTIVTSLNGGSVDMFARISQAQADQLSDDFDVLEGTCLLYTSGSIQISGKHCFRHQSVKADPDFRPRLLLIRPIACLLYTSHTGKHRYRKASGNRECGHDCDQLKRRFG